MFQAEYVQRLRELWSNAFRVKCFTLVLALNTRKNPGLTLYVTSFEAGRSIIMTGKDIRMGGSCHVSGLLPEQGKGDEKNNLVQ
jgi:hypothetical protein